MINKNPKKFWKNLNIGYEHSWTTLASKKMSEKETEFIKNYIDHYKPKIVLDIGVGTGRILEILAKYKRLSIYGIDFIEKMIFFCKERFKNNKNIKDLTVCNIAIDDIKFKINKYDLITAIRVLQYNKNWVEIIGKLSSKLTDGGLLIFTLPNYNSINRFTGSNITKDKISTAKIKDFVKKLGLKVVDIQGFSKIPDFFYQNRFANSTLYVNLLLFLETVLEKLFGKVIFGRVLFFVVRK